MDGFVDVRLHISVRPALEYALPRAARRVRAVLLGDAAARAALTALEECTKIADEVDAPTAGHDEGARDADAAHLDDDAALAALFPEELSVLSARTCTHLHEYLAGLAAEWVAHLEAVRADVARATADVEARFGQAREVRARYLARCAEVTEEEFRRERARLQADLDRRIGEIRARPTPEATRPPALVEASTELKEAFARAYGRQATRRLVQLKARAESEMARLQRDVGRRFAEQASELLL